MEMVWDAFANHLDANLIFTGFGDWEYGLLFFVCLGLIKSTDSNPNGFSQWSNRSIIKVVPIAAFLAISLMPAS